MAERTPDKQGYESVIEIIEQVCEDICDNYCMYRDTVDDECLCDVTRNGGRCPLDRMNFYFEIKDSEIYGGDGEIGYAEQKMDLETCDLGNVKLLEAAQSAVEGFAGLCRVPVENVRIISRDEYEENTEDD